MDKHRDENGTVGETEDEVEAHARIAKPLTDKTQVDEDDDEVEAHVRKANVRMDSPRHI